MTTNDLRLLEEVSSEWDRRPGTRTASKGWTRNVGGLFKGGDRTTRRPPKRV